MSEHAPTATEQDRPRTGIVFVAVVLGILFLLGVLGALRELFASAVQEEASVRQLSVPLFDLPALRAKEQAKLAKYQWVDRKAGIVRIPVDRAAELVLQEAKARLPEGSGIQEGVGAAGQGGPAR